MRRVIAAGIDLALAWTVPACIFFKMVGEAFGSVHHHYDPSSDDPWLAAGAVSAVAGGLYWLLKDGRAGGKSVGGALLGLRVRARAGHAPCGPSRSIVRNGIYLICVCSFALLVVELILMATGDGRTLADRLAGTQVATDDSPLARRGDHLANTQFETPPRPRRSSS